MISLALIASTLLASAFGPPSVPQSRLQINVVFEGKHMQSLLQSAAMEEVTNIWAPYGVDIRAAHINDADTEGALKLDVVLVDRQADYINPGALGSIAFLDDTPQPVIVMYPNTIARLVSTAAVLGRGESEWPIGFREVIMGRVFGRALAHEIGHYLLRAREHQGNGLMQAHQSIVDLVAPDRRKFALSTEETMRLTQNVTIGSRQTTLAAK